MTVRVEHGDCLEVMRRLAAEGVKVDAVVTDPPYHLASFVRRFDAADAAPARSDGATGVYARGSRGFMGQQWDGGDIAFRPETWALALDLLQPGGHLVAFSGTRTYHRMACAIEDAGFEVRDMLSWMYGTGFPKSHDVSKALDAKALHGTARTKDIRRLTMGDAYEPSGRGRTNYDHGGGAAMNGQAGGHAPTTDSAKQWAGWGTALKPSQEPLVVARKPLAYQQEWVTIEEMVIRLWSRLWLMLPVSAADEFSGLSPSAYDVDPCVFAQWSVEQKSNTQVALSDLMDTSQFVLAIVSSLSTVSGWNNTLAEACFQLSRSTTETATSQTIDLRTCKSCLSEITPESIILAHRSGRWSNVDAGPAEKYLSATVAALSATQELSALEPAIARLLDCSLDVGASPRLSPIILARKPLAAGSVAAQVLATGTGALNIDVCRVGTTNDGMTPDVGRWPANVLHDGSPEVLEAFAAYGERQGMTPRMLRRGATTGRGMGYHGAAAADEGEMVGYADVGTAARFFFSAKADAEDRWGSKHPTVKPIALMRWLVRLVTPPGGVVLDPFAGSGSTGVAALAEGMDAILIEREAAYVADICARLDHYSGTGGHSLAVKARHADAPAKPLPLFSGDGTGRDDGVRS